MTEQEYKSPCTWVYGRLGPRVYTHGKHCGDIAGELYMAYRTEPGREGDVFYVHAVPTNVKPFCYFRAQDDTLRVLFDAQLDEVGEAEIVDDAFHRFPHVTQHINSTTKRRGE
jgi:hypothetical protein